MFRGSRLWWLVALLTAAACVSRPSSSGAPNDGADLIKAACGVPHRYLVRIARGYSPERSGELQMIPRYPNFVAFSRPHSDPWDYLQEVPLFFYGPGHVPQVGRVRGRATMADVAPTLGAHLGFGFPTRDGRILEEAVQPGATPPRLVVVVVWDGGGRNVLRRYPQAWPVLRSLIPRGAWYEDAVVGSSPSVTPAVHATLGTGVFPRRHGLVDLRLRLGRDVLDADTVGPRFLLRPTLADLYDRAMGNEPIVATVALDAWHLTMPGQGASFPGGDPDLAALWDADRGGSRWVLPEPSLGPFALPPYLAEFPGLNQEVRALDTEDGALDGRWLGEAGFEEPDDVLMSPAFARWQTAALEELLAREGMGEDEVTDLLFTNYKQIDRVSHVWGIESRQMEAVVRSSDEALGRLIDNLDAQVGEGQWVLSLTADHGSLPPPSETGATPISRDRLQADIEAAFDRDGDDRSIVEAPRVTQLWLNVGELEENGYTLADVARFVLRYTKAQNARDPSKIPEERRDDLLFAAAIPYTLLESGLPCLRGP
jgi:arylsulfatase A-like enzyme